MATYTYKCSDCGNVFEVKATIKEKEEGQSEKFACQKCQSKNIKQEFSAANFFKNVFKGDSRVGGCGCGLPAQVGGGIGDSDNKLNHEDDDSCCGGKSGSCC